MILFLDTRKLSGETKPKPLWELDLLDLLSGAACCLGCVMSQLLFRSKSAGLSFFDDVISSVLEDQLE